MFLVLSRSGIIPRKPGEKLKGLIRFRNILVHDYPCQVK
ncbi:DUF86 domain-containing protein [Candidatus Poribacteria bacterium]|nr:DUF86 domain-containing protein [Candidatus Poribacteria bacterium]